MRTHLRSRNGCLAEVTVDTGAHSGGMKRRIYMQIRDPKAEEIRNPNCEILISHEYEITKHSGLQRSYWD
jgi:hypothetical protein